MSESDEFASSDISDDDLEDVAGGGLGELVEAVIDVGKQASEGLVDMVEEGLDMLITQNNGPYARANLNAF